MLETASLVITSSAKDDLGTSASRTGHHLEKPRRRKSKDRNGRMSGLWCASGQKSPTSSYETTMPYDIPHLVRASTVSHSESPVPLHPNNISLIPKAPSMDSGVDCKSAGGSEREIHSSSAATASCPHHLPPTGPIRPSSSTAAKISLRNQSQDGGVKTESQSSSKNTRTTTPTVFIPKSSMLRSWSSFSLRTFSLRRKESPTSTQPALIQPEVNPNDPGNRMEQSRKRVGGSMPGDDRLNLANPGSGSSADDEVSRKRTHTQVGERLSRLSRSFRRRRSADRMTSDLKSHESSIDSSSSSSSSSNNQAIVLYGTASRCRRSSFKLSISNSPSDTNNVSPLPEKSSRKSDAALSLTVSEKPTLPDGVVLVKILKLDNYMTNKWISGMTISDKNELVLVDLREAYLVDDCGNLIRTIGTKGSERLVEPIGVSAGPEGRLVFSDHAQQNVKVFTNRGNHLRTITDFSLANIAGVACNRSTGHIFVAGTDRKRVFVHCDGETRTIPSERNTSGTRAVFKHPFSVAYNAVSGQVIVGDDYDQSVMAVSIDGQLMWRFCPPSHEGERQFFPSSVCVDQDGHIFVADLYNGKVCMLDSNGQFLRILLSREFGLTGNPGAIATDGKGHIFVADEERTVKVFQYRKSS